MLSLHTSKPYTSRTNSTWQSYACPQHIPLSHVSRLVRSRSLSPSTPLSLHSSSTLSAAATRHASPYCETHTSSNRHRHHTRESVHEQWKLQAFRYASLIVSDPRRTPRPTTSSHTVTSNAARCTRRHAGRCAGHLSYLSPAPPPRFL